MRPRRPAFPVVLTDRAVDSDPGPYKTFIGSDFIIEGERAAAWAKKEFADAAAVNMVVLEGTTGSARPRPTTGWAIILGSDPKFTTLASQAGDFTRDGGKKVMEGFLAAYPNIDVVYAHNDDMGLGAIEAIEAAGKVPVPGREPGRLGMIDWRRMRKHAAGVLQRVNLSIDPRSLLSAHSIAFQQLVAGHHRPIHRHRQRILPDA